MDCFLGREDASCYWCLGCSCIACCLGLDWIEECHGLGLVVVTDRLNPAFYQGVNRSGIESPARTPRLECLVHTSEVEYLVHMSGLQSLPE